MSAGPLAVEAVAGAQGPLATLQALAEAVGALPAVPGAQNTAPPAQAVAPDTALPDHSAFYNANPSAQATQGRLTLGQLATEQNALRQGGLEAPSAPGIHALQRGDIAPEAVAGQRLADVVAVPVMVSALQMQASTPARTESPTPRRTLAWLEEPAALPWTDAAETDEPAPDAEADDEPPPDPQAASLHALLQREGQRAALTELERGRRVLLLLPQAGAAPVAGVAWLLSARKAQRHAARWWAGATSDRNWPSWRVFRDGDPQLSQGLLSRAGGVACRVRLGPQPPRLVDAATVQVEITERIRFAQGLGGQWSLLVLVAPTGTAAA